MYLFIGCIIGIFASLLITLIIGKTIKKALPGTAIVRTGHGGKRVSLDSMIVLPSLHQHSFINLKVQQFDTVLKGENSLKTRKGEPFEIVINSQWRVNRNFEDIINVYETIGEKHADIIFLEKHFGPLVKQATITATKRPYDYEDLSFDFGSIKHDILSIIGRDFGGFILDDLSVISMNKL